MPKSKCVKKRSINKHDSAASGSSNYALTQTTVVDEDENAFIVPSGFAAQSMVSIQSSEQLCDKDDIKTYYYMDFRKEGNMCRFIKHSCSPNLFIQYVFTDSHDTIVPKIAFFAGTFIPAGTALTADIIHKEYLYSTSIWECPLNCEY